MTENRGLFTLDGAQAYLAAEPEMTTEQLSDRLFTITDGQVRTIFLAGDSSVIAFDTFGTPGKARAYAKAVAAAVPDKAITTIIYSHDHLDHAGFAADLAPGAEIDDVKSFCLVRSSLKLLAISEQDYYVALQKHYREVRQGRNRHTRRVPGGTA